jgi:hypothetical protein
MEKPKKNCSTKAHWNKIAKKYCITCKKYLCEICSETHNTCDRQHELYSIDKVDNLSFTGNCKEHNHPNKLEYFCKDDNKLCCAACLCKIKDKGDGQHTECNACFIKDIKEEKMRILIDNINILKDIYNNLKKKYKEVKKINEKAKPKKEEIKQKIIDIFENFQKLLEKRKIELLNEVNNLYDKFFFSDDFINNYKNIISKIDDYYKKAKNVNEKWNKEEKNGKLNLLIDDCIKIEKKVEEFKEKNEKVKSIKPNINIHFIDKDNEEEQIKEKIINFGKIIYNDYKFIFKKCPNEINIKKRFEISGEKGNILTKKGPSFVWTGTTCLYEFKELVEYKWKVRIKNSQTKQIMVGVVPIDFNPEKIDDTDFYVNLSGWFFYCYDLRLYSGPPHNYKNKATTLHNFMDEVIVIMNMNNRTLKFIINDKYKDKEIHYSDIPIDKPLFPAVCLFNPDKVEILEI